MEILLTLAVVVIVALIVIAMDQAADIEIANTIHEGYVEKTRLEKELLQTAVKIGDVVMDQWEAESNKLLRTVKALKAENTELRTALEELLSEDIMEEGLDEDPTDIRRLLEDVFGSDPTGLDRVDEDGNCLACGVNHDEEESGWPTSPLNFGGGIESVDQDYKRTEDVVITNSV